MKPILKVINLSKIYGVGCPKCYEMTGPDFDTNICSHCGSLVACSNVSFELHIGEILGIVGESGSGKSTVIKLINFDINPTAGEAYLVDDEILKDFPELKGKNLFLLNSYQKRKIKNILIGIVYQNPYIGLNMEISAGGNIAEKLIMANWTKFAYIRKRSSELLAKTEFPIYRMDEPPKNFSGGMQQRVQIAKALANNPKIILLDEVTTGLDVSVQARVLDLIRNIHRELKISMILVSHDLRVINLLAERTIVMKYGKIVEIGLTDQILFDPQHYYTQLLVNSQI